MKKKVTFEYLFIGIIILFFVIAASPYLLGTSQVSGAIIYAKEKSDICTDSDGGREYGIAGETSDSNYKMEDWCETAEILVEYSCSEAGILKESYICPQDFVCEEGACVKDKSICSDTDGGRSFSESGTVTRADSSYDDYCMTEVMVGEYYCMGDGSVGMAKQSCAYGCKDGACIIS